MTVLQQLLDPAALTSFAVKLGVFLGTFLVLYLVGRFVVVPVAGRLVERRDVEQTAAQAVIRIVRAGVVVGAAVSAAMAAGFGGLLGGSALVVAALTLALGFAAQDVVGNLVSGVFLVQDPRFNVGDMVEWDDRQGRIRDIGFRITRLRTLDGKLVTVPNRVFTNEVIVNHTTGERVRLVTTFAIGHGADLDEAMAILEEEARRHDEVLDDPPPVARVTEVGDPHVTLESQFWLPRRGTVPPDVRSAYVRRVVERFQRSEMSFSPSSGQFLTGKLALEQADDGPAD